MQLGLLSVTLLTVSMAEDRWQKHNIKIYFIFSFPSVCQTGSYVKDLES